MLAIALSLSSCAPTPEPRVEAGCDGRLAWRETRTERFVFCDTPAGRVSAADARESERDLAQLEQSFGVSVGPRIRFYRYADRAELTRLTGRDVNAWADPRADEVHAIFSTERHELTHLVAHRLRDQAPLISEGVAVWQGGRWRGRPCDMVVGELGRDGRLPPLTTLVAPSDFRAEDDLVTYPVAGSFVGRLIERFGRERFLRFYGDQRDLPLDDRLRSALGDGLAGLEQEWLDHLGVTPGPTAADGARARLKVLLTQVGECATDSPATLDLDLGVSAAGAVERAEVKPVDACVASLVGQFRFQPTGQAVELHQRLILRR